MPFKSKAQIGKMAELEKQGKVAKGTVKKWAAETPKGKLPERIGPEKPKMKSVGDIENFRKKKYGK